MAPPPHFPNQKYTYYQISLLDAHITIGYFRCSTYLFLIFWQERINKIVKAIQKLVEKGTDM